ncbi:MAG: hypothetical protein PHQ36_10770 [Anaerolineales bacterium]|nr:hypothetical protein [Anaerolineales bacterium]
MRHKCRVTVLIAMTLTMSSCAALDSILATPTPIAPTETPRPTPTIIWFPPSVTPTPEILSTRAPTPEMRPNVGETIFRDDFSRASLWDIAASDQASAALNQNRLNLAAQSGIYIFRLRNETILDDYYAEITAAPSLCRAQDSYGFLVRASAAAYYRFSLSCDGTVGAERVSGSSREVLQKPLPSGDVPLGVGETRIGVWARGAEIRLFLNGRYQFSIVNKNYPSGSLGVFVNAAGKTPIVVSFSNLTVQAIK